MLLFAECVGSGFEPQAGQSSRVARRKDRRITMFPCLCDVPACILPVLVESGSVYAGIGLRRDDNVQKKLPHHDCVQIDLDDVRAFFAKRNVTENRHIDRETAGTQGERRWRRIGDALRAVWRNDFDFGGMLTGTFPTIEQSKLENRRGQRLKIDVLE